MTKSKLITITAILAALLVVAGLAGYVGYQRHLASAQANGTVIEVTKDNFDAEVMNSKVPVLIEFTATWCPPCQAEAPLLEQPAKDYKGKVKFVKVDVDKSPEVAAAIGVTQIPTMIVFNPANQTALVAVGFLDQAALKQFIEDGLKAQPPAAPSKP